MQCRVREPATPMLRHSIPIKIAPFPIFQILEVLRVEAHTCAPMPRLALISYLLQSNLNNCIFIYYTHCTYIYIVHEKLYDECIEKTQTIFKQANMSINIDWNSKHKWSQSNTHRPLNKPTNPQNSTSCTLF